MLEKIKAFISSKKTASIYDSTDDPAFEKFSLFRAFWIFVFFSIYGYIGETIANYIHFGYLLNKQGLIYGPISQVYGIAAIILIFIYTRVRVKSVFFIFTLSFFLGAIYEYAMSYIQEFLFGCVSWDYSYMPYNFDGRTSIYFSTIWAIASVLMLKIFYPFTNYLIKKITSKKGIILTWIILVLLVIDISITVAVVIRQSQRLNHLPPSNIIESLIDRFYPESFIEKNFPDFRFRVK